MALLFLFLGIPLIEIALFVQAGQILSLAEILLIVLLTALLGTFLVRRQGRGVLADLQRAMAAGQDPTLPLVHGAMILLAGVLLLTPGFFTDAVGFLLLTPPVRLAAFSWLRRRLRTTLTGRFSTGFRTGAPGAGLDGGFDGGFEAARGRPRRPDVIDADYVDLDEKSPPRAPRH